MRYLPIIILCICSIAAKAQSTETCLPDSIATDTIAPKAIATEAIDSMAASIINAPSPFATADTLSLDAAQLSTEAPALILDTDTLTPLSTMPQRHKFTDTKFYQIVSAGVPLIVTGLIMKTRDTKFRSMRHNYLKTFHTSVDNYVQYLPAAVMLGMKVAGVKSRSSWGRMLVSDAFAVAMMATVVQTIKHTTTVMRPDGSNTHSFPSGHTATAFITATMLSKEYGHISPWISVGAYTVASATALGRIANNKHWMSDVLTGAGIGIITAELGYFLADLIFKEKGINHFKNDITYSRTDRPSFFNVYMGINIPLNRYHLDKTHTLRASSGSTSGFEGAYFFTPHIGAGARLSISNSRIITNEQYAEGDNFNTVLTVVGPYFSYPLSSRCLIGTKALAGYAYYPKSELGDGTQLPHAYGAALSTGVSLAFKVRARFGIRAFVDYHALSTPNKNTDHWMHNLTIGSAFGVTF